MKERILIVPAATKEWWASIIRFVLRSKFNHIFIIYESMLWGSWWAVDIRKYGVVKVPSEKATDRVKYAEFWECRLPLERGLKETRKYVLSGYDILGVISASIKWALWRFTGFEWTRPVHSADKMWCPEYVAMIIRMSGIPHAESMEPAVSFPGDIQSFMDSSIYFKQVDNPFGDTGENYVTS